MREVVFGMALVAAAGAGVYFLPMRAASGPDYPLTVKEAKALLAQADLRKGREPFGRLEVQLTSPSENEVRYAAVGTFAAIDCRAKLTAVGDRGIDVATDCKRAAPSDGAAAATGQQITGIAFAEYVASVLGKRAFDENKVRNASAGAVLHNLGDMQRDALKMQRDMHKGIDQGNAAAAGEEPVDSAAGDSTEPDAAADSQDGAGEN